METGLHSTNYSSSDVDFKAAVLQGQAVDNGLYMLNTIPSLSNETIDSFKNMDFVDIAIKIISKFVGNIIPGEKIQQIVKSALNFKIPLEEIADNDYICYLDRGPTCSFKDFGARMLARIMEHFLEVDNKRITILTATSGDTGGAVAQAFYKMSRIKVVVLYPKNEISNLQRKQMTTLGENISALGIEGKFDDCQKLVKTAFSDKELNHINLSSANSINFGRLVPQTLYYFWSYSRIVSKKKEKVLFSVPSGNFGNLTGGLIAKKMGLPIKRFISAVNENNEFPIFLRTGVYTKVEPSINCLSNAMNVGHPSNLARIFDLYKGHIDEKGLIHKMPDLEDLRNDIVSYSINDEDTKDTIVNFYNNYKKIIEPHGAVGWAALQLYRKDHPNDKDIKSITFETANPSKFPEEIIKLIDIVPEIPPSLKIIQNKPEFPNPRDINNFSDFKEFLLKEFQE
ncbi:MAG: threonine synthase [Candidatus Lokiarchaeota archaeon]|nr:threonine synthase [Candidatus Lokiarchaeota archaeon]